MSPSTEAIDETGRRRDQATSKTIVMHLGHRRIGFTAGRRLLVRATGRRGAAERRSGEQQLYQEPWLALERRRRTASAAE
ncbi:unnamed protein product [Heligmosomoides polygyrus]|uniref:DUF2188 domain-containing protein n=1 Tax=Heligmosomoides polygyrus TaxID=6339 RepID=A0A183FRQ5_HELPZ|nr:unnamed protein product [Heligmosomoides polygyrus]